MKKRCLDIVQKPLTQNTCVEPTIINQPQSLQVNFGESASFSVTASGTGLKYQWKREGLDIGGATHSTFSVIYAEEEDQGSYTVQVYNDCGDILSSAALLIVQGSGSGGGGGTGDGNLFS